MYDADKLLTKRSYIRPTLPSGQKVEGLINSSDSPIALTVFILLNAFQIVFIILKSSSAAMKMKGWAPERSYTEICWRVKILACQ